VIGVVERDLPSEQQGVGLLDRALREPVVGRDLDAEIRSELPGSP
jgi:hypothetical protein